MCDKNKVAYNPIVRDSLKVSMPLLFSLLLQNLINVTDTIFLGRVGEVELGASALAGVFYMAVYFIGFGFGVGVQVLVARLNGERQYDKIGSIVWQSLMFLSVMAIAIITLTLLFVPISFESIISSAAIRGATLDYLLIRIVGLLPAFFTIIYRSFFVGIKRANVLVYSAIAMTLSNVILNYLLIFGVGSIAPMGIKGAALASVLSECIGVVFYLLYTRYVNMSVYAFRFFQAFDAKVIRRILNVSVWTMLQYFISIFSWFLFFLAIEHIGERPLAVSNVVRSLATMLFVIVSSFATSTSSMAGNAMGSNDIPRILPIGKVNIMLCSAILLPILVLIAIFPEGTLAIFTDSDQLITESVSSLYVMLTYFVFSIPGCILFNVVLGTGNTKVSFAIEMLAIFIYILVVGAIAAFKPPVWICWFSEHIYWIATLLASVVYLMKADWWKKTI